MKFTLEIPESEVKKMFKGFNINDVDGFSFEQNGGKIEISTAMFSDDLTVEVEIPLSMLKNKTKLKGFVEALGEELEEFDSNLKSVVEMVKL